jgi:hypothetical protein
MRISAQSLGALAPYVVSAAIAIPANAAAIPANATVVSAETMPGALVSVELGHQQRTQAETSDFRVYRWDLSRPELAPYSFVHIADEESFETYEPFIASEGWRDVSVLEGPFQIEEESRPSAFFDEYDLSTIALYGRQR